MISRLHLYSVDMVAVDYNADDPHPQHLSYQERVKLIAQLLFEHLTQLNKSKVRAWTFKSGLVVLSSAALAVIYRGMCFSYEKQAEEKWNVAQASMHVLSPCMVLTSFYTAAASYWHFRSHYILKIPYLSAVCEQQIDELFPYLHTALSEVQREEPDMWAIWWNIQRVQQQTAYNYFKSKLIDGACYGYVTALLDELPRRHTWHGKDLVENLDLKNVVKKQILHQISTDLCGTLEYGNQACKKELEQMYHYSCKRMLQTTGAFAWNMDTHFISLSKGAQGLYFAFMQLMTHGTFFPPDLLNVEAYHRSLNMTSTSHLSKKPRHVFTRTATDHSLSRKKMALPPETILAGEICVTDHADLVHSLFFRASNRMYHFWDPNYFFCETPCLHTFFTQLYECIEMKYGTNHIEIKFEIRAIAPS